MRQAVATAILSLLPLCAAMGDIYRSVDAQGHVQYSDTPSPGAELVSSSDLHPASSTAATSPPASSSSPPPPPSRNEQIAQRIAQQEAAAAVERDTSAARSKQCKQAQQNYQQSIEARRLFKAGADGERQYLSDDEADQQRVRNRIEMETACGDASDQDAAGTDTTSAQ
jgi:hypothetical protein